VLVDWLLVVVLCEFWSAGAAVLFVLFWVWSGVVAVLDAVCANVTSEANIRIPRTTRNFFMRNSCVRAQLRVVRAVRCLFWPV
jgi:hypothetical protein